MDSTPQLDEKLVEDALALEYVFIQAGLDVHARAVRLALEQAKNDIITEKYYGTDNVNNFIRTSAKISDTIADNTVDTMKNADVIDLLEAITDDVAIVANVNEAPKFIKSSADSLMTKISRLINHLKPQDPEATIDKKTRLALRDLSISQGGLFNG